MHANDGAVHGTDQATFWHLPHLGMEKLAKVPKTVLLLCTCTKSVEPLEHPTVTLEFLGVLKQYLLIEAG